ncbi:MAG: ECF-type sigma factor, partial [Clostridium perfringens]|nr:ECF-type sigma factor [Clostridium perfringens]
ERASRRNESGLTKREQNKKDTYESVQALKSKGLIQKEVAKQLGLGKATVKRHWK